MRPVFGFFCFGGVLGHLSFASLGYTSCGVCFFGFFYFYRALELRVNFASLAFLLRPAAIRVVFYFFGLPSLMVFCNSNAKQAK